MTWTGTQLPWNFLHTPPPKPVGVYHALNYLKGPPIMTGGGSIGSPGGPKALGLRIGKTLGGPPIMLTGGSLGQPGGLPVLRARSSAGISKGLPVILSGGAIGALRGPPTLGSRGRAGRPGGPPIMASGGALGKLGGPPIMTSGGALGNPGGPAILAGRSYVARTTAAAVLLTSGGPSQTAGPSAISGVGFTRFSSPGPLIPTGSMIAAGRLSSGAPLLGPGGFRKTPPSPPVLGGTSTGNPIFTVAKYKPSPFATPTGPVLTTRTQKYAQGPWGIGNTIAQRKK